jgi:hypothetical protein
MSKNPYKRFTFFHWLNFFFLIGSPFLVYLIFRLSTVFPLTPDFMVPAWVLIDWGIFTAFHALISYKKERAVEKEKQKDKEAQEALLNLRELDLPFYELLFPEGNS